MDAYDLANPLHPKTGVKHVSFGVDRKAWSNCLREIADQIDRGDIIPKRAICYSTCEDEEFTISSLVLKFHEKREIMIKEVEDVLDGKKIRLKQLWCPGNGVDSNFPVETAVVK